MQLVNSTIILASAGSRKTTIIIEDALEHRASRILLTTYTRENTANIKEQLNKTNGFIPETFAIETWASFLLKHGVKPYQQDLIPGTRIKSVNFQKQPRIRKGVTRSGNPRMYYLDSGLNIYNDRVSEFICHCNEKTNGAIIKRLEGIYERIYLDELQDIAGWDLNFVELLLNSSICLTMVGDPRQSTYTTNNSQKNRSSKGKNITDWVVKLDEKGLCSIEEKVECYRSNQKICDFADALFPNLPRTVSMCEDITGHDGIFEIRKEEVSDYVKKYDPKVLRYNKDYDTMGLPAINIGLSKGRTYNRVLVFPTQKMKKYLKTHELSDAGDISKLYVAVTRAKYSVTFVID